jgi:hypothetical protein
MSDELFDAWLAALERRHLADLTFAEVSRALRALSSSYVERRNRLAEGAALSGAGKRAAFAMFYGPLHYIIVRHIVGAIGAATSIGSTVVDLGCGTGASGAAWASACERRPRMAAVDRHPWAAEEARWTYPAFGLSAHVRVGDLARAALPRGAAVLAAFAINELEDAVRGRMLDRMLEQASGGGRVLVVEPIAGFVAPWWRVWQSRFEGAGGRSDEWRVRERLPAIVAKLDRAAGMNHQEITARSLFL